MANGFPYFLSTTSEREIQHLRDGRVWFLVLGTAMIGIGALTIGQVLETLLTHELLALILIVAGLIESLSSFWAHRNGCFLMRIVCGLLYLFLGLLTFDQPYMEDRDYMLGMAVFFFATGLLRIAFGLNYRFSGWGWVVLSGAVTLILGLLMWQHHPKATFSVIGTFVGLDLSLNGWSSVMLGFAAGTLPPSNRQSDQRQDVAKV